MRTRLIPFVFVAAALCGAQASAQDAATLRETVREAVHRALPTMYQGRNRGPEQTEHFSRKIKIGRDGRVSVANIAGEIVVTGGSGDEVSIEATKRTRGDKSELGQVQINVEEHAGRVDVRTEYSRNENNHVSVDYIITVPASASVELHSVSGNLRMTGVQGTARMETVSGAVTAASTPRIEVAKSVSGDVDVSGTSTDGDLAASSVSGSVHIKGVKARSIRLGAISGDVGVTDAACDRVDMKSLSGTVEYSGTLARGGRYDLTSHSGTVRMILSGALGFELDASTFSGSINSELALTIGGDAGATAANGRRRGISNRSIHATFGDGSAVLMLRTFSGPIVISKR